MSHGHAVTATAALVVLDVIVATNGHGTVRCLLLLLLVLLLRLCCLALLPPVLLGLVLLIILLLLLLRLLLRVRLGLVGLVLLALLGRCVRLRACLQPQLLRDLLHHIEVLTRGLARVVEAQPLLHLFLQLLAEEARRLLRERVDPARDRALVREVPADPPLVLRARAPDEARVEDEAVLGRVALRLERAEERLLRAEDLDRRCRVLGEVRQ
mmetsp:Transcript_20210/g.52146  ORF Transcript_20210/g.52146 Transcript_20210/m.52146 type:complete len:212 (+) Transcript_20210:120-755(+)